jgi:hypothetical protein
VKTQKTGTRVIYVTEGRRSVDLTFLRLSGRMTTAVGGGPTGRQARASVDLQIVAGPPRTRKPLRAISRAVIAVGNSAVGSAE